MSLLDHKQLEKLAAKSTARKDTPAPTNDELALCPFMIPLYCSGSHTIDYLKYYLQRGMTMVHGSEFSIFRQKKLQARSSGVESSTSRSGNLSFDQRASDLFLGKNT
jgi:hypothetical protein